MRKKITIRNFFTVILLLVGLYGSAAEIYFNRVYKGTGSTYTSQSQSIAITTPLSGSGFKFQSFD